jgi:uncharacterized protein (TIGR02145 family)
MKKLITMTIMVLAVAVAMAQAPEKFSYQAVVRNASNALVTDSPVGIRISLMQGGVNGNIVFRETHTAITNANGLVTIAIGSGNLLEGSIVGIDWANGPYFLKTEIDPNGGSNYTISSEQQLLSVPYALYSKEAGNGFSGDYNDLTNRPQIPQTVGELTNDANYITMDSVPAIPTNVSAFYNDVPYLTAEQQILSISHDTIFLTGGSFVKLPEGFDGDYNSLTNKPTIPTTVGELTNDAGYITMDSVPTNVSAFINDAGYITKDSVPAIPTNVSTFTNDAGYLSSYTETDPQFNAWDKNYNDLTNKPTLFSGSYNDLTNKPTLFSGNYNDLTNKPSLFDGDYNSLSNKPVLFSGNYNDLSNRPTLFDGDYNSLSNRPMIPTVPDSVSAFINDAGYITAADVQAAAGIPTNVSAFTNDAGYITANDVPAQMNADWNATTGVAAILNKPTIPSVPTNVSAFTNDSHYITEVELSNQLSAMNNALAALYSTIDSLQSRIEELEENLDQPIPAQTLGSVTTSPMTYVGVNSAVGGGNVISDGNGSIIARGICWSTSYPPYVTDSHTNDGSTVGPFTSTAIGLNPGTTYYVRAYVTNSVGTAYGDTVSFTTTICNTPTFPTVTMDSVTNILPYTATFHGNVVNDGCSMLQARGFSYRAVDSDPSIWRNFTVDGVSEGAFSATVTIDSLDANKTFYVRAYATNSVGTKIADSIITFVSSKTPPIVTTNNTVTYITYTSAKCGGNVTFAGGASVTKKGLCFGLNENPTIQHDSIAEYNGSGLGAFTCTMTGLTDNTVYHVRAYATNSVGTNYGEDRVFSTLAYLPPSVEILTPTGITYTSFTCSGNVTNEGSYPVVERGIGYSTTPIPSEEDTYISIGSGSGTFNTIISGLTPNTTYYVWAYARNNIGQQANSERIPVTTLANTVPEVATLNVSGLGKCTGKVISTGGLPITEKGFCYSIYSTMPDTTEYRVSVSGNTLQFATFLPNMTNNQSYYVRAYAMNDTGIAYGATIQFTYHTCGGSVTVTDYDIHVYHTVKIGDQCWMKENLKTTHYADGTGISLGTTTSSTVAYYYAPTNGYGLLYNWAAVMHGASSSNSNPSGVQGICPNGWHVPSDTEWDELKYYVGSRSDYVCGSDNTNIAKALADTTAWYPSTKDCAVGNEPSTNNATGFGALPVRIYGSSGYYTSGIVAYFWSATEGESGNALSRYLYYKYTTLNRHSSDSEKENGYSVRCLRD